MAYTAQSWEGSTQSSEQHVIQIDIGEDACEEEVFWWRAILCSGNFWNATTKYNGREYLSPWSVSATGAGLTLATKASLNFKLYPPDSMTALKYLSRFCVHHRLYAQCSVALAGVLYIPFLRGKTVSLPFPKQNSRFGLKEGAVDPVSIPDLINEHDQLLAKYMTLSLNTWGLRSILCSTFFNTEIECNIPRLGILWLGAIFTDLAKSILRDVRTGMTALDLPASAWTETTQKFLTAKVGPSNGESIRREDECRLLFITASEGHDRPPIWPWKPFGTTRLCDAELSVQNHAHCAAHFLEYDFWEWMLTNGRSIQNSREITSQPPYAALHPHPNRKVPVLDDYTSTEDENSSVTRTLSKDSTEWESPVTNHLCERNGLEYKSMRETTGEMKDRVRQFAVSITQAACSLNKSRIQVQHPDTRHHATIYATPMCDKNTYSLPPGHDSRTQSMWDTRAIRSAFPSSFGGETRLVALKPGSQHSRVPSMLQDWYGGGRDDQDEQQIVGFLGELFVRTRNSLLAEDTTNYPKIYELLRLNAPNTFSEDCWTSVMREVHGFTKFTKPESHFTDFTFVDTKGEFAQFLRGHGVSFPDNSSNNTVFHIEVKTTSGGCDEPFYTSHNQFNLVRAASETLERDKADDSSADVGPLLGRTGLSMKST
ncbi:hypothetical protein BO82DRAFT_367207 [Aspergillus uvarum CBS 121591]|uniref:Uncharacterized protein n=1 Tax=Aspergillus uvarum CBS 121591 TaxID=1448315 RepID=A0A319CKA4_9EURO|nr:hypothetical protein BO82DRAFT_367207 [Aspergillus uvarum CBS 121591]PYH79083.1 hypothetical protein BO82DRAFT_367207 [Aspergillus uvarum CBS 121591]